MTISQRLIKEYKIGFSPSMYIERIMRERNINNIYVGLKAYELYEYYVGTSIEYWIMVSELIIEMGITENESRKIISFQNEYNLSLEESIEVYELLNRFRYVRINDKQIVDIYKMSKISGKNINDTYEEYIGWLEEEISEKTLLCEMLNR